jgi:uncharacterized protein YdeI (BOF family)
MRIPSIVALALMLTVFAAAQDHSPVPPAAAPAAWPTAQFAATAAKDPGVKKAKQILDDMIQALGGDAYLTLRDIKVAGRMYAFYHGRPNGLGMVYWRFWQWPDQERVELTKQRDVIELYLGDKGYEITYKGTATQDPKLLDEYLRRRDHSLEVVLRAWLAASGSMILYEGTAIVEQTLADRVTIMTASNDSVTIAIDPRTHLPLKKTYNWRDPNDRQFDEESEVWGNYRMVQGIKTPYSTVRYLNGEMSGQRFIDNVSYNNGFDPALFQTKGITYNQQKSPESKP